MTEQETFGKRLIEYKKETHKAWKQIAEECSLPIYTITMLAKCFREHNGTLIGLSPVNRQKVADFLDNKKIITEPYSVSSTEITSSEKRDIIDKQRLAYINQRVNDFCLCGVMLRDFKFCKSNRLFFIKSGVCRITIEQLFRATRDKYYKLKLERHIQFRK